MRKFSTCPRCGKPLIQSTAYNGGPSEYWKECSNIRCNTYVCTYNPMEHQIAVHLDPHRNRLNSGGFGTGKTTTDRMEMEKHIFITPGGNGLITANISAQYEQTIKREFEADIPKAFVKNYSAQKQYMDFINGYRLMFRPGDDPGKLRSLNLDFALMVEASEMKAEVYHQLKTRLRNLAATTQKRDENGELMWEKLKNGDVKPVIDKDWRKLLVESNPDSGWIYSDMLLMSEEITGHGEVDIDYDIKPEDVDTNTATHVADTSVNAYLPPNFIEENTAGKPAWWIQRYIYSSFKYSEGLVYPKAMDCFVDAFPIPKTWKRIIAFDYGLSDDAVFLFGAIDRSAGMLYIYKEVVMNDQNVEELAKAYKLHTQDIPSGMLLGQPIMDPKNNKRDYNKKDLATHFLEYGIAFKPGHVSLDARIMRLNTYIERDALRVFETCPYLKKQLKGYKYPDKSLDKNKKTNKPVDKDNHAINPLEWIVMELPADPRKLELGVYGADGKIISGKTRRKGSALPWTLQDTHDTLDSYSSGYYDNYTNVY